MSELHSQPSHICPQCIPTLLEYQAKFLNAELELAQQRAKIKSIQFRKELQSITSKFDLESTQESDQSERKKHKRQNVQDEMLNEIFEPQLETKSLKSIETEIQYNDLKSNLLPSFKDMQDSQPMFSLLKESDLKQTNAETSSVQILKPISTPLSSQINEMEDCLRKEIALSLEELKRSNENLENQNQIQQQNSVNAQSTDFQGKMFYKLVKQQKNCLLALEDKATVFQIGIEQSKQIKVDQSGKFHGGFLIYEDIESALQTSLTKYSKGPFCLLKVEPKPPLLKQVFIQPKKQAMVGE